MKFVAVLIAFVALMTSCALVPAHENRENRFSAYLFWENRLLKSSELSDAVWLLKSGPFGRSKIAIFFGYINNLSSCKEMADLHNKAHPEVSYHCRAND
jgi:hypothetical protein